MKPAELFPLNFKKQKIERLNTGDDYKVNLTRNLSYKYRSFVNTTGFVQNREYNLERELHFENSTSSRYESSSRVIYPKLDIQLLIVRSHFFWFINVAIPLYIFVSISLTSFIFDTQELADRLTINLTVLLTTVAYKYIIAEKLPDINYLTVLDVYLLACLFVEYLLIIYNVLAYAGTIPVSSNFKDNAVDYMMFSELCWLLVSSAYGVLSEIIINLHYRERKSKWANPANVLWIAVPPNNELDPEHVLYELKEMPYSAEEKVFNLDDEIISNLMEGLDNLCNPKDGPQDNRQTKNGESSTSNSGAGDEKSDKCVPDTSKLKPDRQRGMLEDFLRLFGRLPPPEVRMLDLKPWNMETAKRSLENCAITTRETSTPAINRFLVVQYKDNRTAAFAMKCLLKHFAVGFLDSLAYPLLMNVTYDRFKGGVGRTKSDPHGT